MAPVYTKLFLLGSGSYGSAWVVQTKDSTVRKVLKEVKLTNLTEKDVDQALVEVTALARCQHENIIQYSEAFVDQKAMILSIVMAYASEGDLSKHITNRRGLYFPQETIVEWLRQLLSALSYIHQRGILHRDIKPQNLFLDEKYILKLGDFGISKLLKSKTDVALTIIGTPFYLSPEICQQRPYSFKSDMWSAGCVLYELCTLHVPFTADNLPSLVSQIVAGAYKSLPSHFDTSMKALVGCLLTSDPEQRPAAAELLQNSSFQTLLKGKRSQDDITMSAFVTKNTIQGERKGSERNRQADITLPVESKQEKIWQAPYKKGSVDSTTYTVVRHPKLRRLSPMSSPELTQLLDRQRSLSPRSNMFECRQVQSVDVPRPRKTRPDKQEIAPRLNLLKEAQQKSWSSSSSPKMKITREQPMDFDSGILQQVTKAMYQLYLATAPCDKQAILAEVETHLQTLLGPDTLRKAQAAISDKADYNILSKDLNLGPSVIQTLLYCFRTQQIMLL